MFLKAQVTGGMVTVFAKGLTVNVNEESAAAVHAGLTVEVVAGGLGMSDEVFTGILDFYGALKGVFFVFGETVRNFVGTVLLT